MPMTPEAFAKEWGFSPRRVRQLARQLGACRILGNAMRLSDDDVRAILEALKPCPSPSIDGRAEKSGITAGRSGHQVFDIGYEDLVALRTRQTPKGSSPRKRRGSGNVVSMATRQS